MSDDPGYGWRSDRLDLPAYLDRIGYAGTPEPTIETLRALHRGHVTSIPFENLEIILGRPITLGVEDLQAKLVGSRRGGYCFEHTRLFAAVLAEIGFEVTGILGRVMIGADRLRPATHALLHVRPAPGDPAVLCDVGFGSGPLEPLAIPGTGPLEQDGWGFDLRPGRDATAWQPPTRGFELHQRGPDGWVLRHTFTLNEAFPIDFEPVNHFVSNSPRSPFTTRPYAQRFSVDSLLVLDGPTFKIVRPDGTTEESALAPKQVPETLAEDFGIELKADDASRLVSTMEEQAAQLG
ncbi:arylamine N-acetyltransferase family protein [Actinomadura roseirufa]|uniref:arylamine N-acetyltransferase family protein n=1 Tax=Actinomadura roseirufa TaxID=2094049 RepID=UPI0010416E79|nr:arylamine N-acetyltransferase [Actinomadura roseirufa]